MKRSILLLLLTTSTLFSFAQDNQDKKNSPVKQFFTEMGGPGIMFSANFDTRFSAKNHLGLGTRVGIGFTIKDGGGYYDVNGNWYENSIRTIPTLPFGINYLFGKGNSPHTFEVGAGATFLFQQVDILTYGSHRGESYFMGHFDFMYRRQPVNGGFSWRIGFTPLINTAGDIVPFGAAGFGFSF